MKSPSSSLSLDAKPESLSCFHSGLGRDAPKANSLEQCSGKPFRELLWGLHGGLPRAARLPVTRGCVGASGAGRRPRASAGSELLAAPLGLGPCVLHGACLRSQGTKLVCVTRGDGEPAGRGGPGAPRGQTRGCQKDSERAAPRGRQLTCHLPRPCAVGGRGWQGSSRSTLGAGVLLEASPRRTRMRGSAREVRGVRR